MGIWTGYRPVTMFNAVVLAVAAALVAVAVAVAGEMETRGG